MADERDLTAGERALGHEPRDGETLRDIRAREAWENRLAPLQLETPLAAPSEDLLRRIEIAIDADETPEAGVVGGAASGLFAADDGDPSAAPEIRATPDHDGGPAPEASAVVELAAARARLSRWKGIAGVAIAAAAAMAIYIAVPGEAPSPAPTEAARYVAVVTADDGSGTGLIIQFDTASGVATVIPAGAVPPDGSSYEMWHLPEGATRPVSLGLLPQNAVARTTITAGAGDLFAISLEPPGGSPTGQPTQALYHGAVVRVE